MKKYFLLISVMLAIILTAACIYYVPYPDEGYPPSQDEGYYEEDYRDYPSRMDTTYFYDYLAPYGAWVEYPAYGYVWIPYGTKYGWRPYTYGRWLWTNHGWTWISSYEWGWAPFHYGRWGWDISLGWFWVPGHIWGPAWVSWRNGGAYIGWAPFPPDVEFVFGVGVRTLPYPIPDTFWVFVDGRYFMSPGIYDYVLPVERNYTIVRTTITKTNIMDQNRVIINQGIDIDTVSRLTRTTVSKYELLDSKEPQTALVQTGEVRIHRPMIRENEWAAPRKVFKAEEAKEAVTRSKVERAEDTSRGIEAGLKEEQSREIKRMEESQSEEVKRIVESREKEVEKVQTTEEKTVVKSKYDSKLDEVKQKHKTEKTLIKQRHAKEEEKTKDVKSKKKTAVKKKEQEASVQSKEKNTKKNTKENSKDSKSVKSKRVQLSR